MYAQEKRGPLPHYGGFVSPTENANVHVCINFKTKYMSNQPLQLPYKKLNVAQKGLQHIEDWLVHVEDYFHN